jgi:site-specific DNA recombinase
MRARRAEKANSVNRWMKALQREVTDVEDRLKRLYRLIENGVTDPDDVLKDRLNSLKSDRDRAKAALDAAKSQRVADIRIDPALIESFGRAMRENVTSGSVPFRKACLRSPVDVIEVDDAQVRIKGSKDVLERAIPASGAGTETSSQMSTKWRATADEDGYYCFAVAL